MQLKIPSEVQGPVSPPAEPEPEEPLPAGLEEPAGAAELTTAAAEELCTAAALLVALLLPPDRLAVMKVVGEPPPAAAELVAGDALLLGAASGPEFIFPLLLPLEPSVEPALPLEPPDLAPLGTQLSP